MKSICAFAVAVFLCASAPAVADSHLSSDPEVRNARALVAIGRFDEALDVLRPLIHDHADQIDVLFLVGFTAIEASRQRAVEEERIALLDEAVAALRTILIDHPGLVRVRLELARAFFLKGDDDLSREHFERVLAGRPVPALAATIHHFLAKMRARRRWHAYFGATVAPDSNIGAESETETIYIHGLPFVRDDADATSGIGIVLWGGGEYQHPLTDRLRLRTGADISQREYGGSRFDQTFVSAHVGPRWLADADTEGSLLLNAQRRWTAGVPESHDLGVRLEARRRFARRLTAHGQATWRQRTYRESKHLDGPRLGLSLGGTWLASPTVRVDATLGYGRERPESFVWRNSTRWARAGASVALPLGFTLGGGGELHRTHYRGSWSPFTPGNSSRKDRTRILRVSVFNRAVTVFGFSPRLVLVNEARASNAQAYDYRRNRAELRFERQF